MKFILHIGTHKTGSTAIQSFLSQNRDALKQRRVLYPTVRSGGSAHHEIAWAARRKNKEDLARLLSDIRSEAKEVDADVVIISSEEFEFLPDLSCLREAIGEEVLIFAFLRRQDDYLESEYNQHVRMYQTRFNQDIFKFYFTHDFSPRFNYRYLLGRWSNAFGRQSVVPVNYDESKKDPFGIYKRMIELAGIDWTAEWTFPDGADRNQSLNATATIYVCRFNQMTLDAARHFKGLQIAEREFSGAPTGRYLSHADRNVVLARFRSSNDFVVREYGIQSLESEGGAGDDSDVVNFHDNFSCSRFLALAQEVLL